VRIRRIGGRGVKVNVIIPPPTKYYLILPVIFPHGCFIVGQRAVKARIPSFSLPCGKMPRQLFWQYLIGVGINTASNANFADK